MKPWFLEADYVACANERSLTFQAISPRAHEAFQRLGAVERGTFETATPQEAIALISRFDAAGLKGHSSSEDEHFFSFDARGAREWAELMAA